VPISAQHIEAFSRREALVEDLELFLEPGHFLLEPELLRMIRRGAPFELVMGHLANSKECSEQIDLDEQGNLSLCIVSPLHPDDGDTNENALLRGIQEAFNGMAEFEPALNFREVAYGLLSRYNDGDFLHYPIFHGFQPEEVLDQLWLRPGWNEALASYENREAVTAASSDQLEAWRHMELTLEAIQDLDYEPATAYEVLEWGALIDDEEIAWSPLAPHILAWPGNAKAIEIAEGILADISKLGGFSPALASFKVSPEDKYGVYYYIRNRFPDAIIFGTEYGDAPRDSEIGLATDDGEFLIN
jgi:hypothetical protein